MAKPVYTHTSCRCCEFVQTVEAPIVPYDIYYCKTQEAWIARFGNEEKNYGSIPWKVLATLDVETRKVKELLKTVQKIAEEYMKGKVAQENVKFVTAQSSKMPSRNHYGTPATVRALGKDSYNALLSIFNINIK